MSTATITKLPPRSEINPADTWDLSKLFATDEDWETAFKEFEALIPGYEPFKGTLSSSPDSG